MAQGAGLPVTLAAVILLLGPAPASAGSTEVPDYGGRAPTAGPCRDVPWPLPADGALCDAAAALAGAELEGRLSREPAARAREVAFLLRRAGVADAHVRPLILRGRGHGELLARLMSAASDRRDATHLGAAVRGADDAQIGVLLLSRRLVRLDPFPATAAAAEPVVISGELMDGAARPSILVGHPDGTVKALRVQLSGRAFRTVAALPAGEHFIEILVETRAGPEAATLSPLYVGVPPPAAPAPARSDGAGDAVAALHQTLSELRRSAGLPPVARDPGLDALAQARARDAAAEGRPVHRSTNARPARTHADAGADGPPAHRTARTDAESRLAAAGYGIAWAGEDLAVGPGALAAFDGLLESPAHRRLLVDPRARLAGIGLHRVADKVYLALLLVEPLAGEQGDGVPGATRVVEAELTHTAELAIRRARRRTGLGPSPRDPDLDALARAHAEHLSRADLASDRAAASELERRALAIDPDAVSASLEVVVAGRPEAALRAPGPLAADCGRLGVGVARGPSRRFRGERLWITLLCTHGGGRP